MPVSEFAGTLNQRIEIWRPSEDRYASGGSTDDFTPILRCWASIAAEGSGALTEAMSVSAMPRFRVTIRMQTEVSVDQQVRWKERRLIIRQLVDDPASPDRLILRCEEQR
jgi:SPP1 family predicted phage head-tail adaptor